MKKISGELDDWLRPEYGRSELGELVRGKYAATQVEFAELVNLMIACIGEDEGLRFEHHSPGNYLAKHRAGDWTYEIDNANQVNLRYWINEFRSVEEPISNLPVITNDRERTELQNSLRKHVRILRDKVND
jgi:hypothetical protein